MRWHAKQPVKRWLSDSWGRLTSWGQPSDWGRLGDWGCALLASAALSACSMASPQGQSVGKRGLESPACADFQASSFVQLLGVPPDAWYKPSVEVLLNGRNTLHARRAARIFTFDANMRMAEPQEPLRRYEFVMLLDLLWGPLVLSLPAPDGQERAAFSREAWKACNEPSAVLDERFEDAAAIYAIFGDTGQSLTLRRLCTLTYAKDAASRVLSGRAESGNFAPNDPLTQGELVHTMVLLTDQLESAQPIESDIKFESGFCSAAGAKLRKGHWALNSLLQSTAFNNTTEVPGMLCLDLPCAIDLDAPVQVHEALASIFALSNISCLRSSLRNHCVERFMNCPQACPQAPSDQGPDPGAAFVCPPSS